MGGAVTESPDWALDAYRRATTPTVPDFTSPREKALWEAERAAERAASAKNARIRRRMEKVA